MLRLAVLLAATVDYWFSVTVCNVRPGAARYEHFKTLKVKKVQRRYIQDVQKEPIMFRDKFA
jgi:hypothetical protein